MIFIPRPIRPPTNAELTVLFWAVFVLLVVLGIVALAVGYRAPVERAEEAAKLIQGGWRLMGAAALMLIIRRFFCGFST